MTRLHRLFVHHGFLVRAALLMLLGLGVMAIGALILGDLTLDGKADASFAKSVATNAVYLVMSGLVTVFLIQGSVSSPGWRRWLRVTSILCVLLAALMIMSWSGSDRDSWVAVSVFVFANVVVLLADLTVADNPEPETFQAGAAMSALLEQYRAEVSAAAALASHGAPRDPVTGKVVAEEPEIAVGTASLVPVADGAADGIDNTFESRAAHSGRPSVVVPAACVLALGAVFLAGRRSVHQPAHRFG